MNSLNIAEVTELKRMLKEKFRMELHFDNEYSAEEFWFDAVPSEAMFRALDKYLAGKRLRAAFHEDGTRFTLEGRF
ncbi:MAG: hypothetical protein IJM51_07365 [Clostridia bacterium]|nr:hypothetical protein [Clostridia bacterium]